MRYTKTKSEAFHILLNEIMIKAVDFGKEMDMERKLIIDGNAVYEIDETCMLKKHLEEDRERKPEEQNPEEQNLKKQNLEEQSSKE